MALHLQELQGRHPVVLLQVGRPLYGEEVIQPAVAVQDDVHVSVAGLPGVLEVLLALGLEDGRQFLIQKIEGFS